MNIVRIALMALAVFAGNAFAQTMPIQRIVGIPARTGNLVCSGASGTVAMTPNMVSNIAITNQSGALTCTTPTAAQLCALFPFVGSTSANFHWDMYLVNAGTGTVTTALGSGVTNTAYTNILTTAANSVRHYMFVLTNCASGSQAAQLLSLGTSVF